MPQPVQIMVPWWQGVAPLVSRAVSLELDNRRLDRRGDLLRQFVLHRGDAAEFGIEILRPDVVAGFGIDQLRADAHPFSAVADGAFENVADTHFAPDLLYVDGAAFVGEARVSRRHEEPAPLGQRGDDVFGDPVYEIFLIGIAAFVQKRQDGDRGFLGQSKTRALGLVQRWRALHPDEPVTAARNSHDVALATVAVQRLA